MAELIYVTDPMCSWCYAFGNVVRELSSIHTIRVVTGGLRPFSREPVTPQMAAAIVHHWKQVAARSGRPVRTDFFARHPDFVYDTAAPSRALHAAAIIDEQRTFDWLDALQARFYAGGEDPTAQATWEAAACDCGIDPDELAAAVRMPESERRMLADFEYARALGIRSFPTLLTECGGRPRLVAMGYSDHDQVTQALAGALRRYSDC